MDYSQLAGDSSLAATATALTTKGYLVTTVDSAEDALNHIKKLIPKRASVMNGSSVTLDQIGFVDYLKSGDHGWKNLHSAIVAETDPTKQAKLRQQALHSDYYLGSVHSLTEAGDMLIASNTGSQLPHIVFTSPNLIFVISTKKIVPDLPTAFNRLEEHVIPLEDKHMQQKFGVHTALNKIVIFKGENQNLGRTVHILLVKHDLGF